MKSPQLTNLPVLTVVVFALGAGGVSMAQTEPEEELEIIELGDRYDEDESASEDDTLGGLIYDQGSQQYRLIEDPEEEGLEEPPSQRETDLGEISRL